MPKNVIHVDAGDRFGRLVVAGRSFVGRGDRWSCLCDCGVKRDVPAWSLTRGETRSCGCLRRDMSRSRATTHGLGVGPLHRVWSGMKQRCMRSSNKSFADYGGRGIYVCDEWHEYAPFYSWAMSNGYRRGLQVDRVDNDGPYSPGNCKFSTVSENCNNTRRNVNVTAFGETKTVMQWVRDDRCSVSYGVLIARVKNGWSHEECVTRPLLRNKRERRVSPFVPPLESGL